MTAVAPHAQYVLLSIAAMEGTAVWPIPDEMSFAQAAFLPLVTGDVTWAQVPGIRPGDTVVVLEQGLVGNLVLQAARQHLLERLIAVDTIDARCHLAQSLGAHVVINAAQQDPVAVVSALTGGKDADLVFDCVGGKPGLTFFAQAQETVLAPRWSPAIFCIGINDLWFVSLTWELGADAEPWVYCEDDYSYDFDEAPQIALAKARLQASP